MESDVLVVDDSAAIRKILERLLRKSGLSIGTIFEAGDGQEALEVLKTRRVHLVLTDIAMPKMDGLQLLAALKASPQWSGLPVVMVVGEGGESKGVEAVKLGAAGYVRKPLTVDQIKREARRAAVEGNKDLLRIRACCYNRFFASRGRFLSHGKSL